jgi:HlyD family secretion protein
MCSLHRRSVGFRTPLILLVAAILTPPPLLADEPKAAPVVLEIKGYLVPARKVAVTPKVSGQIVEMPIEEGTHVKAGDVLARLDPAEYEARLKLARAELKLAEAERVKAVESGNKADFPVAQAKVEVAQAQVALAQLRLDRTVVWAPVTGTVVAKHAEVGTLINLATIANTGMCELADLRTMEVEVEVQERDIGLVGKGQVCRIRLDAFPNKTYHGRVDRLLPVANNAKATIAVRVRIDVPENDNSLRPQMTAVVAIIGKE